MVQVIAPSSAKNSSKRVVLFAHVYEVDLTASEGRNEVLSPLVFEALTVVFSFFFTPLKGSLHSALPIHLIRMNKLIALFSKRKLEYILYYQHLIVSDTVGSIQPAAGQRDLVLWRLAAHQLNLQSLLVCRELVGPGRLQGRSLYPQALPSKCFSNFTDILSRLNLFSSSLWQLMTES